MKYVDWKGQGVRLTKRTQKVRDDATSLFLGVDILSGAI